MTNWNQKSLDALASALKAHLSRAPWDDQHSYLLIDAEKRADSASHSQNPDEKTLAGLRSSVCEVCRRHKLYECDVPAGWSSNCELLKQNT